MCFNPGYLLANITHSVSIVCSASPVTHFQTMWKTIWYIQSVSSYIKVTQYKSESTVGPDWRLDIEQW